MSGKPIVFLWENFGPYHVDRVEAVAERIGDARPVIGIELSETSSDYAWHSASSSRFVKHTLRSGAEAGTLRKFWNLVRLASKLGRGDYFLSHYQLPVIFLFACWLRLTGSRAFAMFDSKFDDQQRYAMRELMKSLVLKPYAGALYGSPRSRNYLVRLGLRAARLAPGVDTVSISRVRALAAMEIAPEGIAFHERAFLCVARLIPKKNHATLLRAYALYRTLDPQPRRLRLLGDGPLECELRGLAAELGIADHVDFEGFVQAEEVARAMGHALALLLPSMEEQFGLVVIEAQAMGLPVIVSENAGARDELVSHGVSGFVVEPDNADAIARFMLELATDRNRWAAMCTRTQDTLGLGDTTRFADGVLQLLRAP